MIRKDEIANRFKGYTAYEIDIFLGLLSVVMELMKKETIYEGKGLLEGIRNLISSLKDEMGKGNDKGGFDDLSGLISTEDAEVMKQAIEDREKVDLNAW